MQPQLSMQTSVPNVMLPAPPMLGLPIQQTLQQQLPVQLQSIQQLPVPLQPIQQQPQHSPVEHSPVQLQPVQLQSNQEPSNVHAAAPEFDFTSPQPVPVVSRSNATHFVPKLFKYQKNPVFVGKILQVSARKFEVEMAQFAGNPISKLPIKYDFFRSFWLFVVDCVCSACFVCLLCSVFCPVFLFAHVGYLREKRCYF
jgi:hypothetical protein